MKEYLATNFDDKQIMNLCVPIDVDGSVNLKNVFNEQKNYTTQDIVMMLSSD